MASETVEFVLRVKGEDATRQFKAVNTEAKTLSTSLKDTQQNAGRAKEAMEGLASALGVVSPELGNAVRLAGQMVGGLKAIATTGTSLAGVLGPVAVAVGALGLAYRKLAGDLEAAEAKMKAAADRAREAQKVFGDLKIAEERAALARRAALGEEGAAIALEQYDIRASTEARRRGAGASLEAELLAASQGVSAALAAERNAGVGQVEELSAATQRAQERFKAAKAAVDAYKASTEDLVIAEIEAAGTAKIREEREKAAAKAIDEARRAQEAYERELAGFGDGLQSDIVGFGAGRVTAGQIGGGLGFSGSAYGTSAATMSAVLGRPVELPGVVPPDGQREQIMMGARGIGGLLQGDVSGLLGLLGPVGAGIGGLANIGAMGAGGVRDQLEGFTDAVVAGLEALPEIITEVIPDFVGGLVSDLIPALVATFPDLAKAMAIELPIALAKAIVEALASIIPGGDAETGFLGKTANTVLDIATLGATYAADVGVGRSRSRTVQDGTGRAMTRRSGDIQASRRVGGQGMGGNVVVNVQGNHYGSMDRFVRDIETHLGYGGPGRSTLLAGG